MRLVLPALLASLTLATAAAQAFTVVNNGTIAYRIDGVNNPTLNLVRGQTYTFNVSATGHPFWIKTTQVIGTGQAYNTGVTGNGTQVGTVTWVVPSNAPDQLYYQCVFDITSPAVTPGLTPLTAGMLVLLLAGTGVVFARRRRSA